MQTTTLIYIILAVLLGVAVAFFQYFFKEGKKSKITILLFFLKTISVSLLILLFLNPKIKSTTLINKKPILAVLSDDSSSIDFFNEKKILENIKKDFLNDEELKEKFTVKNFAFGDNLLVNDSLSFKSKYTDIDKAIKEVNELYKNEIGGIVLLSDGNQTIGNDYEFLTSKKKVFPIVFGDTTQYNDIEISQLNVNKYSYLKNKFPVEALINYNGKEIMNTTYSIFKDGKRVFSKKIELSPTKNTETIVTNLEATKVGSHFYTASISKISNEKNIKNNTNNFSVEVIDEQQKGAILASNTHPDIGAIKRALESNKKRSIDIFIDDFSKTELNDYQFFIIFNPNNKFKSVFSDIKSNFLLISGENTDWNFVNSLDIGFQKKAINQSENFEAYFNPNFLTFQQKDIGFNQFPPLQDKFGKININKESQTLLFQKVTGIKSEEPLLATFENNSKKYAALFGEGIWKWRANSYLQNNSFEQFDAFLGSLIQYIASNKKRNRLELTYDKIYPANTSITISAFYLDKNYLFDNRATLWITLTNKETKENKKFPMTLKNNSYSASLENVTSGEYDFRVSVDNQTISRKGTFKVTDYEVEEQFINANVTKLHKLANNTKGELFFKNEFTKLKNTLINDKDYYTSQSSETSEKNLIDWKWMLFLAIIFLSVEWFIRKYYGKI